MAILINGNAFDFASISVVVGPLRIPVTDVAYSDSVEVGSLYGNNRHRIGRTAGQVSVEASMTLFKTDFQTLIAALNSTGRGYGAVPFIVEVAYSETLNTSVINDTLIGCRITGTADQHAEGTEALKVAVTLDVMELRRNGASILTRPVI